MPSHEGFRLGLALPIPSPDSSAAYEMFRARPKPCGASAEWTRHSGPALPHLPPALAPGLLNSGNHGAMSTSPLPNVLLGMCNDLIGGSSLTWRYHHQVPACVASCGQTRTQTSTRAHTHTHTHIHTYTHTCMHALTNRGRACMRAPCPAGMWPHHHVNGTCITGTAASRPASMPCLTRAFPTMALDLASTAGFAPHPHQR